MEELMIGANMAIVFGVIYKVFELFVCRRERMMLIERWVTNWHRKPLRMALCIVPVRFRLADCV